MREPEAHWCLVIEVGLFGACSMAYAAGQKRSDTKKQGWGHREGWQSRRIVALLI